MDINISSISLLLLNIRRAHHSSMVLLNLTNHFSVLIMKFPLLTIVFLLIFRASSIPAGIKDENELAALRAASYLLSSIHDDYSWGDFTPRALTALSFVERLKDKTTFYEGLKNKLLQLLETKRIDEIPAPQLSHYVNALYAICLDPRVFSGLDLVELLHLKVDQENDSKLPVVILSLCISKEATLEDSEELIRMYDRKNDNIAKKALTIITMASCKELTTIPYLREMKRRVSDFVRRFRVGNITSVTTQAMVIQAYNAWGIDSSSLREQLRALQDEDGSFNSDLLATANAIPALLTSSLADLKCKSRHYTVKPEKSLHVDGDKPQNTIHIQLIVPGGAKITHAISHKFTGKKSLYELMVMSQEQSELYRFNYEELEGIGKKITGISGISNDPESGIMWILYRQSVNENIMIRETNDALDYVYPQDGDTYLFQLEME